MCVYVSVIICVPMSYVELGSVYEAVQNYFAEGKGVCA